MCPWEGFTAASLCSVSSWLQAPALAGWGFMPTGGASLDAVKPWVPRLSCHPEAIPTRLCASSSYTIQVISHPLPHIPTLPFTRGILFSFQGLFTLRAQGWPTWTAPWMSPNKLGTQAQLPRDWDPGGQGEISEEAPGTP